MKVRNIIWTTYLVASIVLVGCLIDWSLHHSDLKTELKTLTELRDAQAKTIATSRELAPQVKDTRRRIEREASNLKSSLNSFCELKLKTNLLNSFEMPVKDYAVFCRNGIGKGMFLLPDEQSKAVAYVRMLSAEDSEERLSQHLLRTLESPDHRIVLSATAHRLTEYQFETDEFHPKKFECRLTDESGTQRIAICDVPDRYAARSSDGPYQNGMFRKREYEVTFGWPKLSELSLIKTLQKRGIWLIACNELYAEFGDSLGTLHVVLVFESKEDWRIHPDFLYCESLEAEFDLQWDPEQQNYRLGDNTR